ncbi:hypothetical protein BHM03_00047297, partial [Ensete ventricosum]
WSPCPWAAPFATGIAALVGGRASLPLGQQLLWALCRSRLPCGLAPSPKWVPPWASPLRVLPMPVGASHTHGRLRLLAAALVAGGCACWRLPLWAVALAGGPGRSRGREENRRGRPKLQPINHESPSYL